ncbi:AraC family transcriptional regulator [Saccharibacillus sacchari]|uniref:AraC family transcriptional regulator n=1 Tax=Saccharibacillus sacchari TaxID=456493 RepID=A0ACC6PHB2_9BACL
MYSLSTIELWTTATDARSIRRSEDTLALVFPLQSGSILLRGEREEKMQRFGVYFCQPEQPFGLVPGAQDAGGEPAAYVLRFTSSISKDSPMPNVRGLPPMEVRAQSGWLPDPSFATLCEEMYRLAQSQAASDTFLLLARFYELLHRLHVSLTPTVDRAAKMDATLAYLRVHFRDPLTAADLAAQAGIGVKHYGDVFRKRYGRSFGQELTRLRIEAASDRLALGHGRLKDIAAEVGYEDEFYFSRRFKQETGVTPTAYMRSRSRPIAALDASFIGLLTPLHYLPRAAPLHPVWRSYYNERFGNRVRLQLKIDRDAAAQADNVALLLSEPVDYSAFLCPSDFDATLRLQLENRGPVWVLDRDLPWRVQLRALAAWLGAEQEAIRWLEEYERFVAEAAKRIASQTPGSFLCLLLEEDRLYICEDRSLGEVFYGDLKLTSAKRLIDRERQLVTPAQLAELDPAHLLMLIYEDPPTMNAWQQLQQDEQWAGLRAVRSKKVHAVASFPWRDYSALPHRLIVEDALRRFAPADSP